MSPREEAIQRVREIAHTDDSGLAVADFGLAGAVAQRRADLLELLAAYDEAVAELAKVAKQRDELVSNLREVHEKLAIGMDSFGSEACQLFSMLLRMHHLGPQHIAAEQPKPAGGGA